MMRYTHVSVGLNLKNKYKCEIKIDYKDKAKMIKCIIYKSATSNCYYNKSFTVCKIDYKDKVKM